MRRRIATRPRAAVARRAPQPRPAAQRVRDGYGRVEDSPPPRALSTFACRRPSSHMHSRQRHREVASLAAAPLRGVMDPYRQWRPTQRTSAVGPRAAAAAAVAGAAAVAVGNVNMAVAAATAKAFLPAAATGSPPLAASVVQSLDLPAPAVRAIDVASIGGVTFHMTWRHRNVSTCPDSLFGAALPRVAPSPSGCHPRRASLETIKERRNERTSF